MECESTNPSDRIDRLVFDPRTELAEHATHFGFYTCPKCQVKTRLQRTDFATNLTSKISPADRTVLDGFYQVIASKSHLLESSLDFYCPGCRLVVRIVYECVEFAMGSYYYVMQKVLELQLPTV